MPICLIYIFSYIIDIFQLFLSYITEECSYLCSGVNPFSPVQGHDRCPKPLHLLHVHLSNIFPFTLSIPSYSNMYIQENKRTRKVKKVSGNKRK